MKIDNAPNYSPYLKHKPQDYDNSTIDGKNCRPSTVTKLAKNKLMKGYYETTDYKI